ncbi:MAG: preprotein translocase subunit SecE [Candidatus Omnitrophica bacterium]|nr:preprotein translocase subunit SecE [Candidatus Omnitrophota bacterium]MBU4478836.1 preprotein translocase subunit SecE [Candidatus Omnitrophota bacterium]MCG2704346.1 preprotein translocase subunit SecE [Candidatus Omnitrophota bacterium]
MNKLKKFLVDVKSEMIKVSWPTRDELLNSTSVVIVSVGALSVFIYIIDLLYTLVVGNIIK